MGQHRQNIEEGHGTVSKLFILKILSHGAEAHREGSLWGWVDMVRDVWSRMGQDCQGGLGVGRGEGEG